MKRNLGEQIDRMIKLSLIKEDDALNVGGGEVDEIAEDKVDEVIKSPEFKRQLEGAIRMTARDLPNQLNLMSTRIGDKDGDIEAKELPNAKRGLATMDYKMAITAPKMAEQLGIALRKSGTEFDVESLRSAGHVLSQIGRELYRTFFKTIYLGIKPVTSHINDSQRKELAEKIFLASIFISTVWFIQATVGGIKSGNLNQVENESEDLFRAIKINLPRWISTITSFKIF